MSSIKTFERFLKQVRRVATKWEATGGNGMSAATPGTTASTPGTTASTPNAATPRHDGDGASTCVEALTAEDGAGGSPDLIRASPELIEDGGAEQQQRQQQQQRLGMMRQATVQIVAAVGIHSRSGSGQTRSFSHRSLVRAALEYKPVVQMITELIRFVTISDNPDPYTREGMPIPQRQRMMCELQVLRLCVECLEAPFESGLYDHHEM